MLTILRNKVSPQILSNSLLMWKYYVHVHSFLVSAVKTTQNVIFVQFLSRLECGEIYWSPLKRKILFRYIRCPRAATFLIAFSENARTIINYHHISFFLPLSKHRKVLNVILLLFSVAQNLPRFCCSKFMKYLVNLFRSSF